MDVDRLTELKAIAVAVKANGWTYGQEVFFSSEGVPQCLGAYACLHPKFVELGLCVTELYAKDGPGSGIYVPSFKGRVMFSALQEFFGVDYTECMYLFGGRYDIEGALGNHATAQVVTIEEALVRIDKVLAGEI